MKKLVLILLLIAVQKSYAQILTSKILNQLRNGKNGEIIQLPGFINQDFKKIEFAKVVLPGPQFVISDDPEYIRLPEAIVAREIVQPGSVRLYVYNVNAVKEPKKMPRKVTAVIKNLGSAPLHLRMLKYSSQKPSNNYFLMGKQGLNDYFSSAGSQKIFKVSPGETVAIDKALEQNVVMFDELVHGLYEFVVDQPAEIAVLQTSPETPGPRAYAIIKEIVPYGHKNAGRGLFGVSNYQISGKNLIKTDEAATQLVIADGVDDPWVVGRDGISGVEAKLAGNYGVMYNVELKWKSTNGKGLALVTWNSRTDNKWCSGMANAILVKKENTKDEIVTIPVSQLTTRGAPEGVLVQVFRPDPNKEIQTLRFTYSPPGASCLPTPLIFIPIDL
ncbi:MAG: copper amine oxidase [Pedobacter sp.]|nr:MAG: copper amine oxidase [Pedobacter sp.]